MRAITESLQVERIKGPIHALDNIIKRHSYLLFGTILLILSVLSIFIGRYNISYNDVIGTILNGIWQNPLIFIMIQLYGK
jgi:hypothetical protein